jgi:hypothetical protein
MLHIGDRGLSILFLESGVMGGWNGWMDELRIQPAKERGNKARQDKDKTPIDDKQIHVGQLD